MKIRKAGFWIEIMALISAIACVLAIFLALGFAAFGATEDTAVQELEAGPPERLSSYPAPGQEASARSSPMQAALVQSQSYEGIVSDTRCGAKHSAKLGLSAGDCTRVCVHSGENFALVDGDKLYVLEGEGPALKRVAGERVKVVGTLSGNTISVSSVTPP
jgi:hypothetical protein